MLVIPSASTAAMITTRERATVDNPRRPASDGYPQSEHCIILPA